MAAVLPAQAFSAETASGWILQQKQVLMGDQTIYVLPDRVFLKNSTLGFCAVIRKGSKHVLFYSDTNKRFCQTDMSHNQQFFAGRLAEAHGVDSASTRDAVWKDNGLVDFKGIKCNLWVGKKWLSPEQLAEKKGKTRTIRAWLPVQMKCDAAVVEMVARVNGWPNFEGATSIPIYGTMQDGTNRARVGMEFVSFKAGPIKNSLFSPALGKYTKVKSTDEVVMGGGKEGLIEDMAGILTGTQEYQEKKGGKGK